MALVRRWIKNEQKFLQGDLKIAARSLKTYHPTRGRWGCHVGIHRGYTSVCASLFVPQSALRWVSERFTITLCNALCSISDNWRCVTNGNLTKTSNTVLGGHAWRKPNCVTGKESLWNGQKKLKTHPHSHHLWRSLTEKDFDGVRAIPEDAASYYQ